MSRRLVRTVLVPLFVAVALFVVPLAVVSVRESQLRLIEVAERHAATAALLASTIDQSDRLTSQVVGLAIRDGERVAVVDTGGRIVADSGRGALRVPQELEDEAAAGRIGGKFERDRQRVVATAPVARGGAVRGLSVVMLPADDVVAGSRPLLVALGVSMLGLVIVAAYAAQVVARWVVRPVQRLDETALRLGHGDLSARAPTGEGPPEVRRLAATLNAGAARLQELLAAQRAFVADASHQLRTPLTGLRLRVEAMEMAGVAPEKVAAVSRELDRLTGLVEQMLTLARAEGGRMQTVPVDVAEVVADRVALWRTVADVRGVALAAQVAADLPKAHAVEGALEQILDNYLSNGVRVAPPGSTLDVEAGMEDDRVVCRVADRGPGLTAEQRRHAFERFWQSSDGQRDGSSGLGLAIVAELADASDAAVALHNRDGGGLVALVTMRRAPP